MNCLDRNIRSADYLIDQVTKRDGSIVVDGDNLRIRVPAGRLDEDLQSALKQNKDLLIETLRARRVDPLDGVAPAKLRKASLTPWQESFWSMHLREDADLATLHANLVIAIDGLLDVARFARAVDRVSSRHEMLRMRFCTDDRGIPFQYDEGVGPVLEKTVVHQSFSKEVQSKIDQMVKHRFDLASESAFRFCLISEGAHHHKLLFVAHHVAVDGWSVGILLRDLFAFYREGHTADLPAISVSPIDSAQVLAQRQLAPEMLSKTRSVALELSEMPLCQKIPPDIPRGALHQAEHGESRFDLPRATAKALTEIARQCNGGLYSALLAGFHLCYQALTGQERLVVMSPVANRNLSPHLEPIVTCLANGIVLMPKASGERRFLDRVSELAVEVSRRLDQQDLPFDQVVALAGQPRLPNAFPCAQVYFALQNAADTPQCAGLDIAFDSIPFSLGRQDLLVEFRHVEGDRLTCRINFDGRIFKQQTVDALASMYERMLAVIVENPTGTLDTLAHQALGETQKPSPNALPPSRSTTLEVVAEALDLTPACRIVTDLSVRSNAVKDLLRFLEDAGHSVTDKSSGLTKADIVFTNRETCRIQAKRVIHIDHLNPNGHCLLSVPGNGFIAFTGPAHGAYVPATVLRDKLSVKTPSGQTTPVELPGFLTIDGRATTIGAKKTGSGELWLCCDLLSSHCTWLNGRFVDKASLSAQLLRAAPVSDAAVSIQRYQGGPELIAWIVPGTTLPVEDLIAASSEAAKPIAELDHVVPVSAIPRDRDGGADPHRLSLLPVAARTVFDEDESFVISADPSPNPDETVHAADILPPSVSGISPYPSFSTEEAARLSTSVGAKSVDSRPLSGGNLNEHFPGHGWSPLDWLENQFGADRNLICREYDGTERCIGYDQVMIRVRSIASGLQTAGVSPGDTVVLAPRYTENYLTVFLAALAVGAKAALMAPAKSLEPGSLSIQSLCHIRQLTGATYVILDRHCGPASALPEGVRSLEVEALAGSSPIEDVKRWNADEIALIAFTSGSTGLPKGVPLTAENLSAVTAAMDAEFGFTPDKTALNFTGLDHVASLIGFCGSALRAGCQLALFSTELFIARPEEFLKALSEWRAAYSWGPDFAWKLISELLDGSDEDSLDFAAFEVLFSGGECPLNATFAKLMPALLRNGAKAPKLKTAWGMAETTSIFTLSDPWEGDNSHLHHLGILDSGRPLPGQSLRIVDSQNRAVPEGEVGKLQVRGPSVFQNYFVLNSENEVEERSPLTSDGWLQTGDLAFSDGRRVMLLGREKDVIVLNGQNIAQAAIEDRIDSLDGVRAGFSTVIASRETRCGRSLLTVFFCPENQSPGDRELTALIKRVSGTIGASYGVRPDFLLPVTPADIPKTNLGKIQRTQLRRAFENGDFENLQLRIDCLLQQNRIVPARLHIWRDMPRELACPPAEIKQRFLVSGPDTASTGLLCAQLREAGHAAQLLTINATHPESHSAFQLSNATLVDLTPLNLEFNRDSLEAEALRRVKQTQAISNAVDGRTHMVWCDPVFSTGFGGAIAATMLHEFDRVATTSLTIENASTALSSGALARWLTSGKGRFTTRAILASNGTTSLPRLVPLPGDTRWRHFPRTATILVPGGTGSIAATVIPTLLNWTDWRFVLIGRKEPRAVDAFLKRLTDPLTDVSRVNYRQADAGDTAQMQVILEEFRPAGALNLTGRLDRTPIGKTHLDDIKSHIETRLRVARNLDTVFKESGGTIVHITSTYANIGRRDFLCYNVANAAHSQWIQDESGPSPRHVDLLCGQWLSPEGPDSIAELSAKQGFGLIDGQAGAAGILRAFTGDEQQLVLGLDLNGSETRPHAQLAARPLVDLKFTPKQRSGFEERLEEAKELADQYRLSIALSSSGDRTQTQRLSPTEQKIMRCWRSVLETDADIAPETNFFDAGGTSLLAARLHRLLLDEFGKPENVVALFAHTSVRAQARMIENVEQPAETPEHPNPSPRASRKRSVNRHADRRRATRAMAD